MDFKKVVLYLSETVILGVINRRKDAYYLMTTLTSMKIKISRMAINAIDLNSPEPLISEKLFPLGEENKVIDDFFRKHVVETREGKYTKSCKFLDEDATIKTKIKRYSSNKNDDEFLKLSKELTENLFKIMKNSSSNSNGTFFVIELEINDEGCIFIIKLDPKQGVQVNYDDLTVSVLENILPDTNDRVHKCAIIRFDKPESGEAELFVMDKQQKEGEPARFFIETFLQAEEILNDRIMTKEVVRTAKEKFIQILPEVNSNKIFESIDKEFSNGKRIELKQSVKNILLDNVPADKEDRELFINKAADIFVSEYLHKFPDHQTSFIAERKDNIIVYRSEKDQIFFRYNKGIITNVNIGENEEGDTIITIDKDLRFKRDVKI